MNTAGFSLNDIERGALSSAMQSTAALAEVMGFLSPEHFANFANRLIFTELSKYWESGKPYDLILFTAHLNAEGVLEKIGGASYVQLMKKEREDSGLPKKKRRLRHFWRGISRLLPPRRAETRRPEL